jgi:hypothetical protein
MIVSRNHYARTQDKEGLTPAESFAATWLMGTTCRRHDRLTIHWQSADGRFIVMKHKGHFEYTGRWSTGGTTCETYYCLYDLEDTSDVGIFGEPNLKRWAGRWNKAKQAELEKAVADYLAPKPKLGRKVQKLIDRLKSECNLKVPDDVELRRVRGSRDQRECGAWSWVLGNDSWQIAGYESVTKELTMPFWRVSVNKYGDQELDTSTRPLE